MRFVHFVLAAGLVLAAASPEVLAQDSSWTLRFHGAIVDSSAGTQSSVDDGIVSRVDTGGGFDIGAEYRFSKRFGLEFSVLFAGVEIGSSVSPRAGASFGLESGMVPLTLAVPFHFDVGDRMDLFVAPTVSIVRYLDIESYAGAGGVGSSVDVENDTGLGAALGLDVPFGKGKWAFSSGLRYMKTSAEETDIDPVIVMLGAAYRF